VVLEDNLAGQSRNYCQNNRHKSQKHVLYRILQENYSKLRLLQVLITVSQF